LFEKLKNLISTLVLNRSKENRLDQLVVNLDMLRIVSQGQETSGISLISLASLQEKNEGLEGSGVDLKLFIGQKHGLEGLTDIHRVFLLDANSHDQIDDVSRDLVGVLIVLRFNHVFDDLLEVLLLGVESHRLQQASVDGGVEVDTAEEVA